VTSGRRPFALVAVLALLLVVTALPMGFATASTASDQALSQVQQTYLKLLSAGQEGANVTILVNETDEALSLISSAEALEGVNASQAASLYQQAATLIQQVNSQIPSETNSGREAAQAELIWLAAFLASLAVVGGLVYFCGSRIFWTLWIRLHRGWTVRKAR
jgi:hypothetical protein